MAGIDEVATMHTGDTVFPDAATDIPWFADLLKSTGHAALLHPLLRKALTVATVDFAAALGSEKRARQKVVDDQRWASEQSIPLW